MELISGSTAMDAFGGWKAHNGEYHLDIRALSPVAMSNIRFPKIGLITKSANSSYDIDAIPGIGGLLKPQRSIPRHGARQPKSWVPSNLQDEIIASIRDLPGFQHSNVIDWDNSGPVPWEVVEFHIFLNTVPPPMDLPANYDANGNLIDEETLEVWGKKGMTMCKVFQITRKKLDVMETCLGFYPRDMTRYRGCPHAL
ncbi:hypothetical protein N7447_007088 [Penicillium robsamsonii]|uniref:uncharacterized protein n=1 Tax=Penicillium robsamsonii TaxID=1792511 RepID=UPI00254949EB|nr:uncharacterized protein N7447_007088 [Penicillium robsamsonii]KAJ5824748.1 hypothetical protein N7447_007088 [Penicillium robsamsonii]